MPGERRTRVNFSLKKGWFQALCSADRRGKDTKCGWPVGGESTGYWLAGRPSVRFGLFLSR